MKYFPVPLTLRNEENLVKVPLEKLYLSNIFMGDIMKPVPTNVK